MSEETYSRKKEQNVKISGGKKIRANSGTEK